MGDTSSDAISNEECDLIYEWSHGEGKRSREKEILIEMILSFSEVSSCLEEEEESERVSSVKAGLEVTFYLLWLLKTDLSWLLSNLWQFHWLKQDL